MKSSLFALVATIPIITGPAPSQTEAITARLCNGGVIELPLPGQPQEPPAPCEFKGCHAGCSRKRFDSAQ